MFLFFIGFCLSERTLAIDFGSQYLKFGYADLDTSETTVLETNSKYGFPAAVAIKTPNKSESPLTNETLNGIKPLIGREAAIFLHKHPKLGSEYILSSVTRNDPDFRTSTVANQTTLLSLLFFQFLNSLKEPLPSSMTLTFPNFFTPKMRQDVFSAIRFFKLPISHVADDVQALSAIYADTYLTRYVKQPRRVLFVDIGAGYAKVNVIKFTWETNKTISYIEASDFSDRCGGYGFAKALAKSVRLPVFEAERLLKDIEEVDFAKSELDELKRIINSTVESAGLVDEVQIIGGASNYKFIYDAVTDAVKYAYNLTNLGKSNINIRNVAENVEKPAKKVDTPETTPNSETKDETHENISEGTVNETATLDDLEKMASTTEANSTANTNNTTNTTTDATNSPGNSTMNKAEEKIEIPKVLREFDATNAVLKGTLHLILAVENRSIYNPTYVLKRPVASYYVKCGKQVDKYCQKNSRCKTPTFLSTNGCEGNYMDLLIDKRHTPTGSPELIGRFRFTNISEIVFNNSKPGRAYAQLNPPDPVIEQAVICNSSSECFPVGIEQILTNGHDIQEQMQFFESISNYIQYRKTIEINIANIKNVLERIRKVIYPPPNSEQTMKIDESVKEKFDTYWNKVKSNELEKMSLEEIKELTSDLKGLALSLGFEVE
ncbi:hypothetical protein TRFO_20609 [Tritrichomonas foetus]|uniref:DnaK protein n=1 Tax=Tritrichomonas foetus TaxID=1144522 RepID=A0A1J4KGH6_9EUKA|nr:hypothetical protein TRFO_20609 [Tritrichomonas foetus]|eukprot:OHT10154.1 hypothetical protein TRFO_20609 [Tritrichomonas foetus]